MNDKEFMEKAIEIGRWGLENNKGGPFGAIIVREGKIIGKGYNSVTSENDPTAHAEINAIREACKNSGNFKLEGCVIYSTCEPCPMCLGAIYWAGIKRVVYGCTNNDAEEAGFLDAKIYSEQSLPFEKRSLEYLQIMREKSLKLFEIWKEKEIKTVY